MKRNLRILLVDDDALFRKVIGEHFTHCGFNITVASNGQAALKALVESEYDVMLLDIQMPGLSGLETLKEIRQFVDPPEVIMLTGDTSLSSGLEAMRVGAYDYLTKPAGLEEMEALILKAYEKRQLVRQNASLRAAARVPEVGDQSSQPIIFKSPAMAEILMLAETAAQLDSTVVLSGESGTGKDVVARFIHANSPRRDLPLVMLNCGAVPESLFESEFFGHERGAFTGANSLKRGLVEAADGSTLFLDEVGDLPLEMQVKLLHFLEQGVFRRVGTTRDQSADVRVIAATNRNLSDEVAQGRFRADLFYRLNVLAIHIPPLRERPEDVPALVDSYLALYRERFKRPELDLSPEARQRLANYDWPGNVRELRNCLERAAALSRTDLIQVDQFITESSVSRHPANAGQRTAEPDLQPVPLAHVERDHILSVLRRANGNRERAAAILGISSRTLYRKLREYEAAD
jgi:two-component system, NtrC family, response regulator AtoC